MHNLNVSGTTNESVLHSNIDIIDTSLDGEIYHKWWGAPELFDAGAGGTPTYDIGSLGSYPSRWVLPDATTTAVGGYIRRHPEWRNGFMSLIVHYDASISGGDFDWRVSVDGHEDMQAVNSTQISETVNAPAVANVITSVTFHSAALNAVSSVDGRHIGVYFYVGRRGVADTNNGDIRVYGVELVYNEAKRIVGSKG